MYETEEMSVEGGCSDKLCDHTCWMVSLKCRMVLTGIIGRPSDFLKHLKTNRGPTFFEYITNILALTYIKYTDSLMYL